MAADERFKTNPARVAHRQLVSDTMEAKTKGWKRDDLLAALENAGVPAGPINSVADVFEDPQFIHRGMRITPDGVPGIRTPIRFSETPLALDRPSPRLGEHDGSRFERS
jgi:crotonobetainyl-CoA:carnitine CoA-transferase CaiB-like acyl-CoA transferase